ncbi:MAG TPA: hypothetical protein V6D34_08485 [Candidatus Sericytochromatia bacterium]|jgi:hypothetical protein
MNEIEKVKSIITNSGNSFHCKTLNYLKEKEWSVLISPYYNDNFSDKPREIDLIAEKEFSIKDRFSNQVGNISVRLFIECKYIPQLSVIWFHDKDKNKAEKLVVNTTPLRANNSYTNQHHYIGSDNKAAKLFASEKQSNVENDPLYKALNQCLNAIVYYRNYPFIIQTPSEDQRNTLWTLNYPVIVCNSFNNFYGIDIDLNQEPIKISDNFQLEVNYAYMDISKKHKNEYFLIDVLAYEKIDSFLEILQEDVTLIGHYIK